jgi:hypothetical protein
MDGRLSGSARLAMAAVGAWAAAQALVAATLRVEGYDGYWYLSNAWFLAGGAVSHFESTKAPLVSLMALPWAFMRRGGAPELVLFIGSHAVAASLTLLTGVLLARALSRASSAGLAWSVAFAFLSGRIVFRYAAFTMSDLPAALAVLLTLFAAQRGATREGWGARLPLALAGLAVILARYPAALVMPVAVAWDVIGLAWRSRSPGAALRRLVQHAGVGAATAAAALAIHFVVYAVPFGGPGGAWVEIVDMVTRNARLGGITVRGDEPWWEYLPMLLRSSTLPIVALMALGLILGLGRGGGADRLHAAWAVSYLLFASLISSHKEARYLLPALPSLYILAARGAMALAAWARRGTGQGPPSRLPGMSVVALVLVCGAFTALAEGRHLAQPFFREGAPAAISRSVAGLVPPPGRLAWVGNFYPLVPPERVFDPRDEYYYVFHLAPHVIEYYTGRPVLALRDLPASRVEGVLLPVGAALALHTGDGMLSSVPEVTVTRGLEVAPPPLALSAVRVWDLLDRGRESSATGATERIFSSAGGEVRARVGGQTVRLSGFPGLAEIHARTRGRGEVSLGLLGMAGGAGEVSIGSLDAEGILTLRIVHYTRLADLGGGSPSASP